MHVSRSATCLAYRNGLQLILLVVVANLHLNLTFNWLSTPSYLAQKSVHKPSPYSRIRQIYACTNPKILFLDSLIHFSYVYGSTLFPITCLPPVVTKVFNQSPFVTTRQREKKDGVVSRVYKELSSRYLVLDGDRPQGYRELT